MKPEGQEARRVGCWKAMRLKKLIITDSKPPNFLAFQPSSIYVGN